MKNTMLKRRLNPFLVATTVLVLALLAGLSVMYQGQLSDILSEKKSLSEQLEQKNEEIADLQQQKANLSQKLSDRKQDVNTYTSENEQLKNEIDSLKSEISGLESDIGTLEEEKADLENELTNTENTRDLLNASLGSVCEEHEENLTESSEDTCESWGHE